MLVRWGLFNLVEGLIDHEILGIHNVRYGPNMVWWDIGFLAFGVALVLGGWVMQRTATPFRVTAGAVRETAVHEYEHASMVIPIAIIGAAALAYVWLEYRSRRNSRRSESGCRGVGTGRPQKLVAYARGSEPVGLAVALVTTWHPVHGRNRTAASKRVRSLPEIRDSIPAGS
jgi:hypothetical protein